jgi:hypothetical protein
MLVRAVTKAWQESLDGPPSIGRVYQPKSVDQRPPSASVGWCRPNAASVVDDAANDDVEPGRHVERQVQREPADTPRAGPGIVPKRRAVAKKPAPADSLWTSYEFWMGIVAGAGFVLVIKTVLAVQAPFGVYWY